jgi:hypothetical protein
MGAIMVKTERSRFIPVLHLPHWFNNYDCRCNGSLLRRDMEVETAPSELARSPQIRSNGAMIWVIFRPNQAISLTSTNYR